MWEECVPGVFNPGLCDGYAPHTSRMRILTDAGEYDLRMWKYKRIRIPRIYCTPEGVQWEIEACALRVRVLRYAKQTS